MLLPLALALTILILPLLRATRINWPRWWGALAFVLTGLLVLVGPYIADEGGPGDNAGDRPGTGLGSAVGPAGPGA